MPDIKSQMRAAGVPTKVKVPKPNRKFTTKVVFFVVGVLLAVAPIGGPLIDTEWGFGPVAVGLDNSINATENSREAYDALDQHLPDTANPLEMNRATSFTYWNPPDDFIPPDRDDYYGAGIDFDGTGNTDVYGGVRMLANIEFDSNGGEDHATLAAEQCDSVPIHLNDGDSIRAVNTDLDTRDNTELTVKLTDDDTLRVCNGDGHDPESDDNIGRDDLDNLYIEVVESSS